MNRILKHTAAIAALSMISTSAFATMTVNTTGGLLSVECDQSGTVVAKVVAPDDTIIVNERYEGNQFTWSPAEMGGAYRYAMDGAYRYDVRIVIPPTEDEKSENEEAEFEENEAISEYAGGSLEVRNGEIINPPLHTGEEQ